MALKCIMIKKAKNIDLDEQEARVNSLTNRADLVKKLVSVKQLAKLDTNGTTSSTLAQVQVGMTNPIDATNDLAVLRELLPVGADVDGDGRSVLWQSARRGLLVVVRAARGIADARGH